jgi:diguanylate cyclase (GGDEF)-like protein/PAS domain S-box-containing protein
MSRHHSAAWKGALVYLLFGAAWILGSDALLEWLVPSSDTRSHIQTYKGLVYVGLTAALAWWLLALTQRAYEARLRADLNWQAIFEHAEVGLTITDLDGRLLVVNERFCDMVGRSADALAGTHFKDLTHPDDVNDDLQSIQRLLSGELSQYRLNKRYVRPDGEIIWARLSVSVQRDDAGEPRHLISAAQDISDLKAAQSAVVDSEQRLRAVIDCMPDALTVRDPTGRYLLCNPVAAQALQRPAEQVVGLTLRQLYEPAQVEQWSILDQRAIILGAPVRNEFSLLGADGLESRIDINISPLKDFQGAIVGVVSLARDVTAQRVISRRLEQSERRTSELLTASEQSRQALLSLLEDQHTISYGLARNEARLQAVMAALPDLVFLIDGDGRFLDMWASQPELLIAPREQVLGRLLGDFLPAPLVQQTRQHLTAVLAGKGLQVFEYALGLDHAQRWFEMRMVRAGAFEVLAVARDISLAHSTRAALERSEASLRLALEGSGDGLWDWDLRTNAVSYSVLFQRQLGYAGNDFHRDFVTREHLHDDDRASLRAALRDTLRRGAPFDVMLRLRDFNDGYRWFRARGMAQWDDTHGCKRFSGVMTDLTAQREAEERLRLAATVLDNTLEGVVVTDAQACIVSINPAFHQLMGYSIDELRGRKPSVYQSGRHSQAFYAAMWTSVKTCGHWHGEIWNRRKDGQLIPQLLSVTAVRDSADSITHYVGVATDISKLKESEAQLQHLAHHDPLTQLPNRLLFHNHLEQALLNAERDGTRLAVLLLDLDRFKDVNDSYGHLAGDEMLQHVASRLRERLRRSDTLARLGGDEFALLMQDVHHNDDAARLASELISALIEPWRLRDAVEIGASVSVGICMYPEHGRDAQTLLQGADAALYRAKADGRGVYRYFADEMTQAARERLRLETRLRRAIAEQRLVLHYQPQVDIRSGQIVGAEALVRWLDPDEGLIPPGRFIPVAEATGLIADVGAWVLREACQQGRRWLDAGLAPLTLAVNVSSRQFHHTDLADQVMQVLLETGYPAEHLELELTESALMEREQEALEVLHRLRGMGVGVAIDDFGTGYSSLSYLKRFPLDVLKIDRSFITDIPQDSDDMEIAAAVIAMGHSLGIRVLAEGVETAEQLDFLRLKGCDSYQGFFRSRPVAADEFVRLLDPRA